MTDEKCDFLVFSGAGLAGVSFLGALDYIMNKSKIGRNVTHCVGTSAGSIIALIYVLGLHPKEIYSSFADFNKIFERNTIAMMGKLLYSSNFGSICKTELVNYICKVTKVCKGLTFKELFERTGKGLYAVATDIARGEPIIFSHLSTPNMSVAESIAISCSIPFVFECSKITDPYGIERLLVDGGMSHCYPIDLVDPENGWNGRAIGVTTIHDDRWTQPVAAKNIGMTGYVSALINSLTRRIYQLQASQPSFHERTIVIDVGTTQTIEPIKKKDADQLYKNGYYAASDFFADTSGFTGDGKITDPNQLRNLPIFRCHTDLDGIRDY